MNFFGKLTVEALKHDWIEYLAGLSMLMGGIGIGGSFNLHQKVDLALERMAHVIRS